MFNTHQLTAKIHQLLPQVCAKNNIKQIEVEFDFVLSPEGKKIPKWEIVKDITIQNKQDYIPAIEEPQIRQILVGLQKVLGENPKIVSMKKNLENLKKEKTNFKFKPSKSSFSYSFEHQQQKYSKLNKAINKAEEKLKQIYMAKKHTEIRKSLAETLCQKWLDGLNPLFDREPLTVLQEWEELLLNLLK